MVAGYLSTDIIVIVVLVVVLVIVGIGAFFIHFYWTKIGVAEIWNTAKWSSMRSSFYRTIRRFSGRSENKFGSSASFYSDGINDVSVDKPMQTPKITSYIQPVNNPVHKPVAVIPYNDNSARNTYGTRPAHTTNNSRIYNINESNDLASRIQKQRF